MSLEEQRQRQEQDVQRQMEEVAPIQPTPAQNLDAMTEDEQLAYALRMSLQDSKSRTWTLTITRVTEEYLYE